jgi:hypothetical protein
MPKLLISSFNDAGMPITKASVNGSRVRTARFSNAGATQPLPRRRPGTRRVRVKASNTTPKPPSNDRDGEDGPRAAVRQLSRDESFVGIIIISTIRAADKLLRAFGVEDFGRDAGAMCLMLPCTACALNADVTAQLCGTACASGAFASACHDVNKQALQCRIVRTIDRCLLSLLCATAVPSVLQAPD